MTYRINWEPRGVYVQFQGKINQKEFNQASIELQNNCDFADLEYIICDLLGMTEMDYGIEDIEARIHFDKAIAKSSQKIKNAFVASNQESLTLASYYQSEMTDSSWDSQFFSSLKDARTWIDSSN